LREARVMPSANDYEPVYEDGVLKYKRKNRLDNPKNGEIAPRDSHDSDLIEDKAQDTTKALAQAIRDFIGKTQGTFSTNQLDSELGIVGRAKTNRRVILWRLIEEGLIERLKPGYYRIREASLPDMEWQNADTTSGLDIKLPFEIHNWVEIFPKNILVIAGTSNAGKTAYLLNFIKGNMQHWDIHYFTSELSEQELKKRISKFGDGMDWQFHAHERNSNFDSVVIPDAINIIDYLEPPSGEYYAIGDQIKAIHERLTIGIAFIAIQKKRKTELGRGAEFSEERARLYLSMDAGKLKIVKAKNWRTETNPNGMLYTFKLINGCKFIDIERKPQND
jgi:predicted DNA-binding antitoxin AbrB/MazE fold protein